MRSAWIVSDSIVSPLGNSSDENYENVRNAGTGIKKVAAGIYGEASFFGSVLDGLTGSPAFTRFETLAMEAARGALGHRKPDPDRTVFILSTTKGNIELLAAHPAHARIPLHACAAYMAAALGFCHTLVVSNACISGVLALITAKRFLVHGRFDHALVVGAEVLSPFIVAGFQSLHALSHEPCKPFDRHRSGISLGEAAGAILLTAQPGMVQEQPLIEIRGEGLSNDANHISGPSRTGKELAIAITHALQTAGVGPDHVHSISAHGTATIFNDEMEAKAFACAGMENVPLTSLKGNYGHTLGAAGVIETIITKHGLVKNEIVGTKGYAVPGVSSPVHVNRDLRPLAQQRILKTASGFGGCNAALILEKKTI